MMRRGIFQKSCVFLILWLFVYIVMLIPLCVVPKGELHLLLCDHHTAFLDMLMPILSDTCNWLPYVGVVLMLMMNWRAGLTLGGGLLLSTAIVQPLKHAFHAPRPLTWFATNMPDVALPLTPGVKMHFWYSFPSGHSTTFFAFYMGIAVLVPMLIKRDSRSVRICWSIFCYLMAILSCYSRIYLSQHFLSDVLAGALIGVLSMLATMLFAARKTHLFQHTK